MEAQNGGDTPTNKQEQVWKPGGGDEGAETEICRGSMYPSVDEYMDARKKYFELIFAGNCTMLHVSSCPIIMASRFDEISYNKRYMIRTPIEILRCAEDDPLLCLKWLSRDGKARMCQQTSRLECMTEE